MRQWNYSRDYAADRIFHGFSRSTTSKVHPRLKLISVCGFALAVGTASISLGSRAAFAQQAAENTPAQSTKEVEEVTVARGPGKLLGQLIGVDGAAHFIRLPPANHQARLRRRITLIWPRKRIPANRAII